MFELSDCDVVWIGSLHAPETDYKNAVMEPVQVDPGDFKLVILSNIANILLNSVKLKLNMQVWQSFPEYWRLLLTREDRQSYPAVCEYK